MSFLKKKVLLLVWDINKYYFKYINEPYIDVYEMNRRFRFRLSAYTIGIIVNKCINAFNIKFDFVLFKIPIINLFCRFLLKLYYDDWCKHISFYDKIIVFDTSFRFDNNIFKNISFLNNEGCCFLYFWNKIKKEELDYFSFFLYYR